MENCFFKKLKGAVNNDNLEKLGCITFKNMQFDNAVISFENYTEADKSIFTAKEGTLTRAKFGGAPQSWMFSVKNGSALVTTDVEVSNKYKITEIADFLNVNIERFKTLPLLEYISGYPKKDTNFVDFNISTLKKLFLKCNRYQFISFEYEQMAFLRNLGLTHFALDPGDVSAPQAPEGYAFSMSMLGRYLPDTLTYLRINTYGADGSIEDFVIKAREHRTTGTLRALFTGATLVTFNGASVTNIDSTLSWTSNTITYNGVTINV